MSERKKTFNEWWAGLHAESRQAEHRIKGVLKEEGFHAVPADVALPISRAMNEGSSSAWERHAGAQPEAAERSGQPVFMSLSREAQAWLLCHLIAELGRLHTEIADIEIRKLRHPVLAAVNGISGPSASLREIALTDDARLAREVLQALNDARGLR